MLGKNGSLLGWARRRSMDVGNRKHPADGSFKFCNINVKVCKLSKRNMRSSVRHVTLLDPLDIYHKRSLPMNGEMALTTVIENIKHRQGLLPYSRRVRYRQEDENINNDRGFFVDGILAEPTLHKAALPEYFATDIFQFQEEGSEIYSSIGSSLRGPLFPRLDVFSSSRGHEILYETDRTKCKMDELMKLLVSKEDYQYEICKFVTDKTLVPQK